LGSLLCTQFTTKPASISSTVQGDGKRRPVTAFCHIANSAKALSWHGGDEPWHAELSMASRNALTPPRTEPDNAQNQRREYGNVKHCINHASLHSLKADCLLGIIGRRPRIFPAADDQSDDHHSLAFLICRVVDAERNSDLLVAPANDQRPHWRLRSARLILSAFGRA